MFICRGSTGSSLTPGGVDGDFERSGWPSSGDGVAVLDGTSSGVGVRAEASMADPLTGPVRTDGPWATVDVGVGVAAGSVALCR